LRNAGLALGGAGLLVAVGLHDNAKLNRLPPEERAALIRYRDHAPLIESSLDAASSCLNYAGNEVGLGRYGYASSELQNCRRLIRGGREFCPAETTKAGRDCTKPFRLAARSRAIATILLHLKKTNLP
jgi:hypothetical protein